jgi:hypothetical protein
MRTHRLALAALALAGGVSACHDAPSANRGEAVLRVVPRFSRETAQTAARLADFGISYDRVRITVRRPPADVVADTTFSFGPSQSEVTLTLEVKARSDGEVFDVTIQYLDNAVVVFEGSAPVQSHPPSDPEADVSTIDVRYVGPGANTERLVLSPTNIPLLSTVTATITAQAFDAAGNAVATVPLEWTSSNTTVAALTASGLSATLRPNGPRGSVTVTATTPTGVHGEATASISPPPTGIFVISGGAQTGVVGNTLVQPAVVEVRANDGLGVPGMSVAFTPPSGGSVGTGTATTDASGRATTSLRLGTVAGAQTFGASAAGFSVSVPATALAGPVTALQFRTPPSDVAAGALLGPAVQVSLLDSFGNLNPSNAAVSLTLGGGTAGALLSGTITRTASSGVATFDDLSVDWVGGAYTLTARAPSLGSMQVTSGVFNVTAAGAAGIRLAMGGTATASVGAGQDLTVPIRLDLSNRGTLDLASISLAVSWDPTRFVFKSFSLGDWRDSNGTSASITTNTANAEHGALLIAGFTTVETLSPFTLGTLVLGGVSGGAPTVVGASVTAAGNAVGSPIVVTPRALTVTINP